MEPKPIPSAIAVNIRTHLAAIRVDIPRKRSAGRLSLFAVPPPEIPLPASEFRQWRQLEGPRPVRDWRKKFCIPGRNQARGGKISVIKDGDPHRNGGLSSTSQT